MRSLFLIMATAILAGCSKPGTFTPDAAFKDSLSDFTRHSWVATHVSRLT
jgi:hypothetical protein